MIEKGTAAVATSRVCWGNHENLDRAPTDVGTQIRKEHQGRKERAIIGRLFWDFCKVFYCNDL